MSLDDDAFCGEPMYLIPSYWIENAIHRVQILWFSKIIDADYLAREWARKYGGPKFGLRPGKGYNLAGDPIDSAGSV